MQSGGTVDTTKNNGNIAKQTVTFSGLANPFVQAYKYDSLDRLAEAKETVNGTQTWIQNWGYDRYGNRSSFSQNINGNTSVSSPTIDTSTNRFNGSQGYTFDKNGNVINDPTSGGRTFVFNGDNKQTQVKDSSNAVIGTYSYDGEGHRVKKVTATETTVFVYSNGKLIEERNSSAALQTSYIYAGTSLLATETATDTNYTATDHLGSPRVITNASGAVVSRRDFRPFGEELFPDGTYRKASDNYSTTGIDTVRQRFTGYQKDTETGLDFAEARYYQNQHGRFTAVDPLQASGKSSNPQTFNRYSYVLNNPVVLNDPTGLQAGKSAPPTRISTPIYVDSSGNHFSTVKSDYFSTQFSGTAYASSGNRNYQITGNGLVEIGIPPRTSVPSAGTGDCSCLITNSGAILAAAKAMLKAAAVVLPILDEMNRASKDPQLALPLAMISGPLGAEAKLADEAIVVRNGEMVSGTFANGSGVVAGEAGTLSGVSVKSANGLTLDELALGPLLTKNNQIGVSTAGAIRRAGGTIIPDNPTNPLNPFHCEICGLTDAELLKLFEPQRNPVKKP